MAVPAFFTSMPLADHPGWNSWDLADDTRFNAQVMGQLMVRREGGEDTPRCRLRMLPEHRHTNLQNMIHGAVTLSLIDISLFSAQHLLGRGDGAMAVTLEVSTQFIGAGDVTRPLDAVVEVLRETGRMMFLRGDVVQEADRVAAFSGVIRKVYAKP
ncbi:MAG: PaaI family thioesterase [Parerythrobacter sp.]